MQDKSEINHIFVNNEKADDAFLGDIGHFMYRLNNLFIRLYAFRL